MKTLEYNARWSWLDTVLNWWPCCLHRDTIGTLFTLAWDELGVYRPESGSLFYNGAVMLRVTMPFGIWLHVKPVRDHRFQCGIGWKLNGRFAILFRWQSDAAAAAGVHGPNYGQAGAWHRGTA